MWKRFVVFVAVLFILPGVFAFGAEKTCDRACLENYIDRYLDAVSELFKIENGLIRRIEAAFLRCPYGMNSGWSTYQQTMSEEIQSIR